MTRWLLLVNRSLLLATLGPVTAVFGQNLVPNPGFEDFTSCPAGYNGGFGPLVAEPWFVPTMGSSDYFNACNPGVVGVPVNAFGVRPANSGVAYAGGLYYYEGIRNYREYLQVRLSEPLIAGKSYVVSLYYTFGVLTCPVDKLGIHFSDTEISLPGMISVLDVDPQIETDSAKIDSTWHHFATCYVADGGEEWMTIGNFYQDSLITLGTNCPKWNGMTISYAFVDDVSVVEAVDQCPTDVEGIVRTPAGLGIANVMMELADDPDFVNTQITASEMSGQFSFVLLPAVQTRYLRGHKNNDLLNGVSTLDLIALRKHLLGIRRFDSPFQFIAADVNGSDSVTVMDLVVLRDVILGKEDAFPNNTSWRFIDDSQIHWSDNPWGFDEVVRIPFTGATANVHFTGIKTGDITMSASTDINEPDVELATRSHASLVVTDQMVYEGMPVDIAFRLSGMEAIAGIQFAIAAQDAVITHFHTRHHAISDQNYHIGADGKCRVSWDALDALSIQGNELLFTMRIVPLVDSFVRDIIEIDETPLKAEAYMDDQNRPVPLTLHFSESEEMRPAKPGFEIIPNPWSDQTTLRFFLTKDEQVTFRFYDMSGRLVREETGNFAKGCNRLDVFRPDLACGQRVIICQMMTSSITLTRRMVQSP